MNKRKKELKTYHLTGIGLMSAIICILGPITIPIGVVPVGFVGIAIYTSLFILGKKKTVAAVFVYLLIGMVGVPVFSGFTAGPGKLLGPTGGYLIGYLFSTIVCGELLEKVNKKKLSEKRKYLMLFVVFLVGNSILYILGSWWLAKAAGITINEAVTIGVFPFLLPDLLKNVLAISLGRELRRRLRNVEMQ